MCVCARRQPSPTAASPGSPWSPVRCTNDDTTAKTPRVRSLRPCPAAADHGVGGALGTAGRVAVAVTAKVALCCVDRLVQLPGLGARDVHGDAPSMVADERDLPVGLVRGAVDPGARLAPEAADLVRRWGAEAAAEVLVEEQAHLVALDGQRIVVLALLELDVALAGLVVEGAVTWAAPRLASEVCDTRLPLRVAEGGRVGAA